MAPDPLGGDDIGKFLSSSGPVVKCVLLRCRHPSGSSAFEAASAAERIDPTRDVSSMKAKEVKRELESYGIGTSSFVERKELNDALLSARECRRRDDNDSDGHRKQPATKNDASSDTNPDDTDDPLLSQLVEEIEVDTTPRKAMVAKILGGPFTFLGQYEDEGIVVMVRRPSEEGEAADDVGLLPANPHKLQPPLHRKEPRGNILLMRVAPTPEELDSDDGDEEEEKETEGEMATSAAAAGELVDEEGAQADVVAPEAAPAAAATSGAAAAPAEDTEERSKDVVVLTNDEFFLDYTRDEYLKFASRTDIVARDDDEEEEEAEEEECEEEVGDSDEAEEEDDENDSGDDDDEGDEEFRIEDGHEEIDMEEHQVGMMNLILGQILRKFHEEHGRGPDTRELLEMRKALAEKLGVDVPPVDEESADWDRKAESLGKDGKKKSPLRKVEIVESPDKVKPLREGGVEGQGAAVSAAVACPEEGSPGVGEKRSALCEARADGGKSPESKRAKLGDIMSPET